LTLVSTTKNEYPGRGCARRRYVGVFAVAVASCLTVLAVENQAHAQDMAGAANAFSRAQKAELSGNHDTAAELYELADSLAPAPEALRSALKARKAAGQLGSAAQHAEKLLRRYPNDKRSRDLAEATLDEARRKLARIEVHCRTKPCGLVVDGAAGSAEPADVHVVFLEPGKHEVTAAFGADRATPKPTNARAGDRTMFTFDPPPPSASAAKVADASAKTASAGASADTGVERASKGRLSPWFFVTGAVVTAGLAGVTIWSGLDTLDAHKAYQGNETEAAYQAGLDKERRTNILIGATAVAGVATGVIAVFTRWSGPSESSGALPPQRLRAGGVPLPGGAVLTVSGDF
jgi:tetratricopeptide (TPR) repeat protein